MFLEKNKFRQKLIDAIKQNSNSSISVHIIYNICFLSTILIKKKYNSLLNYLQLIIIYGNSNSCIHEANLRTNDDAYDGKRSLYHCVSDDSDDAEFHHH